MHKLGQIYELFNGDHRLAHSVKLLYFTLDFAKKQIGIIKIAVRSKKEIARKKNLGHAQSWAK